MMRLFFWRRRGLADFAEAIRPELRAIATPEPSTRLLERILASRAAGRRVILPEPVATSRRPSRPIVAGAIAAALLLIIVPVIRRSAPNAEDVVAPSTFFGREAFARPLDRFEKAELPPLEFVRPAAIRPLVLEFSHRMRDVEGRLTSESTDMLAVVSAEVGGTPAWRVQSITNDVGRSHHRVRTETLYVARANLRLLSRAVHVSPYSRFERINIQQMFRGDSVTGRMTTDGPSIGAGRPIARKLRPEFAPYLTDTFAPLALMTTPLSSTWQARVALLGWAVVPSNIFVLADLRVEGTERVQVPAGTFDCWRLSIRFGGREISYWARLSDGLGVRVFDQLDSRTHGSREIVLTRIEE